MMKPFYYLVKKVLKKYNKFRENEGTILRARNKNS